MLFSKKAIIDCSAIEDTNSFHSEFKFKFGFPSFYGGNMDELKDSLSCLDDKWCNVSKHFQLGKNEHLTILVNQSQDFKTNYPELFLQFIEVIIAVNERYSNAGSSTRILLELV